MKTLIKEVAPLAVAFLMTGSLAQAMAPPKSADISKPVTKSPVVAKAVTPAPKPAASAPVAAKEVTWHDNPQHCTDNQYISAEAPYNCIDKSPADSAAQSASQPTTTHQVAQAAPALPTGSHTDWMAAAGISPANYSAVEYIVTHESGWRVSAMNPSGAYGLCQSLPASKMASAGADWQTNPVTQLIWCNSYAISRYGGWQGALGAWLSQHWW